VRSIPANHPGDTPSNCLPSRTAFARPKVAVLVYDGLAVFEFGVTCDVFGIDRSQQYGRPWYKLTTCAAQPGPVTTDTGLKFVAPSGLRPLRSASTVVVPPTERLDRLPREVLSELRRAHERGARVVSLCTGAFVLAAAGLLSGRRATTHWADADRLSRQANDVDVDPRALYVQDGKIFTSAGSSASIDLCLHIVRQDFGIDIATKLARELVVPLHREGDQAQYIEAPFPDLPSAQPFLDALEWAESHLDQRITMDDLAKRSAMSPRTFARRFNQALGTTPYQWLVRRRVSMAQLLLETTDHPIEIVAASSGFSNSSNLRKHFSTATRTSPQSYRRAFRSQ
jgi:AraC family transcriptional regulator, transcriptional activator FtrA